MKKLNKSQMDSIKFIKFKLNNYISNEKDLKITDEEDDKVKDMILKDTIFKIYHHNIIDNFTKTKGEKYMFEVNKKIFNDLYMRDYRNNYTNNKPKNRTVAEIQKFNKITNQLIKIVARNL